MHRTVLGETVRVNADVRGAPGSCAGHRRPRVTRLWVSAALQSMIETVNLVGRFLECSGL